MTPTFSLIWFINKTIVFVLLIIPDNFLIDLDISLACAPIVWSSICPCNSARGTNAATESITIIENSPVWVKCSTSCNACSPESGWEITIFDKSTPNLFAWLISIACSASIKAATPPCFWASAIASKAIVVLPEDSGP